MEFLLSAFSSLMFSAVPRQVGYMIHYRSNLEELMKEVEELRHLRESVKHRVDAATRNGEKIEAEIAHWLNEVDEIVAKAEWYLQDQRLERTGCSSTSLPNLRLRHQFGKRSKRLVSEIVQLRQGANFDRVSYGAPISWQFAPLASTEGVSNSRVSTLEGILESLKDPNLNMIGVCGPAGVGKTTLVQQVLSIAAQNKLFDVVVWVTVSPYKDLERIKLEMADQLGIKFRGESVYEKAALLWDRLMKEKSFLVILDDLWEELDLQEIGIPVQKESFKIIVVSRSQKLLHDKMKTQKDFNITTLPENDAWNLFKEMAGIESNASPELLSVATKVAANCAGLPLAIVTIARSLKGRNLEMWKDALNKLQRSALVDEQLERPAVSDITGMQDINDKISESIRSLEKDAESILYLCGLIMGEDDFAKSIIFNYSVGLGLFEDIEKMKEARDRFDTCISSLEDLSLLMKGNSSEFSRMHDLIRDAVIFLASKHQRYFVRRHQKGEEWPDGHKMENCTTIMLSDQDINEHPEGLNCQNINFFQLLTTDSSSKLPDSFFKGKHRFKVNLTDDFFSKRMPGLKVLDLTAVEFISGLPSSVSHLKMLTALLLDYSVFGHISDIGKLKVLKILSLSNSSIKELPHELGQLTQLQFLDLSYCFQLEVIPPNVFSNLKSLEELYMLGSFDDWDVNDPNKQQQSKASIVELTNLSCLTTLEVVIPNKRMLPGPDDINRLFANLERGKVILGRQSEFSQFFEYETLEALGVWLSSTVNENGERMLAHVDYLGIGNLKGTAGNIVPRLNGTGFPQLKYLFVGHSGIQYLADPSGNSNNIDLFPTLHSLVLHSVRNLEKLCSGPLTRQSFSRLKFITIKNCNKLKSLLSFSLVNGLPHLCEIGLESCYSMEGVVSDDRNGAAGMLQFPELRNLYMENLPELIGFRCEEIAGNNNLDTSGSLFCDKIMSPNLEILDIKWTKNLKTIWQCSQLLSNCFGKLKKIDIRFCMDLISIFPRQIISTIPFLETLTVAHCESLQDIVMTDVSTHSSFRKEVGDGAEIVFAKLKFLELNDCSNLRRFCSELSPFRFPLLDEVIISKCPHMKIFCCGDLMTPVLKSVKKDGVMHWEGDLNTTITKWIQ